MIKKLFFDEWVLMSEDEVDPAERCCSYCLLPPKVHGKKLKRCSRCHRAWYHDAECQRKHFPVHKRDCKKWSASILPKPTCKIITRDTRPDNCSNGSSSSNNQFHVVQRSGRGKCLVVSAGKSVRKGERIRDNDNKQDFWEPLILPVLTEENRSSRCSLCFGPLPPSRSICSFNPPLRNPLYRLLFCSISCREIASRNDLDQEEQNCFRFLQRVKSHSDRPRRVFATAILLYRILIHECQDTSDGLIRNQVHALQGTRCRGLSNEYSNAEAKSLENYHTRGVIAIALGMLQCAELSSRYHPSMEYLADMVHRIKVNGFSIFYESDFETCGIGLYGTPSFMNHSCRANALQTFLFRPGSPPSLYVTAFRDIAENQEICISYTDSSYPSHLRRQRLEKDYFFVCNCEICDNDSKLQDDHTTMAIRCLNCYKKPSSPPQSTVIRADEYTAHGTSVYRCKNCNTTDFEFTLQKLQAFENDVCNNRLSSQSSSTELLDKYRNLQRICYINSWYVQEAGDRLLQNYLDKLPMLKGDPPKEEQMAWTALKLAEELLSSAHPPSVPTGASEFLSTSSFLRHQHLRYKAAKLRLFLVPDPRQSIQELREVLSSLQPYFSKDHEFIVGLQGCLVNAMM